jgi:outer membrane receptor protein involved in Fe transport
MKLTFRTQWHIACSALAVSTGLLGFNSASAQDRPAGSAPDKPVPASAPKVSDQKDQPDDIVITATKREERLRDVPGAVTAITGANIDKLGVQSFRDYASLVPGLSQRDAGAPGLGTVILRGLNSGAQQLTNTTAYYIDDTPFTASGFVSNGALVTPEPELAEIDRIEVLKGPQGTLYGASSLGGLIHVVTKKPDATAFFGSLRGELSTIDGGGTGYMLRGSVNLPLVRDKLAIQATGYYRRMPGYTDNVVTGTDNVNKSDLYGGRIAIRATPTDRLTIDIAGVLQHITNDGYNFEKLIGGTLTPLYGLYKYNQYKDFGSEIRYRVVSGTATWKTDIGSLIASGSYARYQNDTQSDATGTYLPVALSVAPGKGYVIPANTGVVANPSPSLTKYTGEIRFVSKRLGPVEFMVGGFYTHEQAIYDINVVLQNTITGVTLPAPLNFLYHTRSGSRYEEVAGYGDLTFYLTDRLDVQGGIRYAHNTQLATTGGDGAIYAFSPRAKFVFPIKGNATTYLATLRWRPTDTISAYVRAASGYRPGGPQTNPSPPPGAQLLITPDTVWNYEAGVKSSLLNGALTANIAVYHIDWKNIQLNTLDATGVVLQANGGAAKVDGWELELVARPSKYLTFTANAGQTNARLTSILSGVTSVTGAKVGNKLPLTPEYTVAITGDQRIPLADRTTGFVGATLRFQSDMPNNYPGASPALQPKKLPSITTVDLRAGVDFARFGLQLRVQNLLNERAITNVGTDFMATVIPPRRYTLAFSADF